MNTMQPFGIHTSRAVMALVAAALLSACATSPAVPDAARSELAPTGKLRVGLLVTNSAFVSRDGAPEEMQGVGVEIGRELAKQLGVAFEPVRYRNVAALLDGAKTGQWDVSPIGYSPERRADMDFTAPYLVGGSTYLVPLGSAIKAVADVDKPGHRVVVPPRSAQDTYLTGNLKHAQLVRVPASEALELMKSGKAHAYFNSGPFNRDWAAKRPEFRIADGSIALGGSALAVAKGRPAGLSYAAAFIEYVKATGLVQDAIEYSGLEGVSVAPQASAR